MQGNRRFRLRKQSADYSIRSRKVSKTEQVFASAWSELARWHPQDCCEGVSGLGLKNKTPVRIYFFRP